MAQMIVKNNERPTKRSKVEKDCSKTYSDLTRAIEGNNANLDYLYPMFMPTISSSSDASSPTIPPTTATIAATTTAVAPFRDDKGGDDLGEYELGGPGKQLGSREEYIAIAVTIYV